LGGFDEYSKLLNELIKKEGEGGNNYDFLRKLEEDFQKARASEPEILKTKIFEKMANDLDKHLQSQETKYQEQFDKLSTMARKCAETEARSVSQPTRAIRPSSVCSMLSFVCKVKVLKVNLKDY
jgi:hypothetical protein